MPKKFYPQLLLESTIKEERKINRREDLDFTADSGGALAIDLDSETLTFTGGTGIDTSGSGNAVTFAIDSTVATLAGTQTFTNKTLTSPKINEDVFKILSTENSVESKNSFGGTASREIKRQIRFWKRKLNA